MPRLLGKAIGVGEHTVLLRALGLRELTSGLGILSRRAPTDWMRSRVAGDVMDLALLGVALLRTQRTQRVRVVAATVAVAGVTALDVIASNRLNRRGGASSDGAVRVRKSILINRPVEELYAFWRNLENLPRIMSHLRSVQVMDDQRSRWVAEAPGPLAVEWAAEITEDMANERIAWCSLDGSKVFTQGSVEFQTMPAGRGTRVQVDLEYRPPGGHVGAAIAKLFPDDPERQIQEELRRFKQLMETGEIARNDSPHGRRSILSRHLP
jgi:uncharacterized membrane protein